MDEVPWTTVFWDTANFLREREILCDLELRAPHSDGSVASFYVHKLLFSLASKYLMQKMLQNELGTVESFNNVSAVGLNGIVKFVYGQSVTGTQDEYRDFLQAANILKVPHAKNIFRLIVTKTRKANIKIAKVEEQEFHSEIEGKSYLHNPDETKTIDLSRNDELNNKNQHCVGEDLWDTSERAAFLDYNSHMSRKDCSISTEAAQHLSGLDHRRNILRRNKPLHVYICTLCNNEFPIRNQFVKHQREIHNIGKEFKCEHCDRTFQHKTQYVYHIRSHTKERPYTCDQCGKRFAVPSTLKLHKEIHKPENEKKISCPHPHCNKKFAQKGNMERHILGRHTKEKIFTCDICGVSFHWRKSLMDHCKRHNGPIPKSHKCDECEYAFDTKYKLQRHKVVHSSVKPFECDWCGQQFTQVGSMNKHKKETCKMKAKPICVMTSGIQLDNVS